MRESISRRCEFEELIVVCIVCILLSIIFVYHWRPLPSFPVAEYCYDVPRIKNNTKVFYVGKDACNTMNQTSFAIQNYFGLVSLQIESNSFQFVNSFVLNTLPKLKEIQIGDNSFEGLSSQSGYRFSISKCTQLSSVSIGRKSFSQYSDEFEIRECPSLERIVLHGFNFQSPRLVLDGTSFAANMLFRITSFNEIVCFRNRSLEFLEYGAV